MPEDLSDSEPIAPEPVGFTGDEANATEDGVSALGWVVPTMRVGFAGRAAVYLLVGGLAVAAAVEGGSAEGTSGALERLGDMWWGQFVLALIALGLAAYSVWRLLDGALDLDNRGTDAKGLATRAGMIASGAIHAFLAGTAISLAMGGSDSGSGQGGAEGFAASLMEQSGGRWLVGIAGVVTIGAGLYQFVKAYKQEYLRHLRSTRTTDRLDGVMRVGVVAHGVVIAFIGAFLAWAAWTYDPSKAGGLGQAFDTLRDAPFGQVLIGVMAVGLLGFAVYCAVNAGYRVVHSVAGEVKTLADR